MVVVAAVGNVDVVIDGAMVVLAAESVVLPQATRLTRRGRSKSAFFTQPFCRAIRRMLGPDEGLALLLHRAREGQVSSIPWLLWLHHR